MKVIKCDVCGVIIEDKDVRTNYRAKSKRAQVDVVLAEHVDFCAQCARREMAKAGKEVWNRFKDKRVAKAVKKGGETHEQNGGV